MIEDHNGRQIYFGDNIRAVPGTITDLFAEGRTGQVVGLPPYSNNHLVRWDGDTILMGFHPENVEVICA